MCGFRNETASPYEVPRPVHRRLRIYSIDPSLSQSMETAEINQTTVEIPWESYPVEKNIDSTAAGNCEEARKKSNDGPAPGPRGEYLEVIDYDPASIMSR